jgi:CDP-glycerol glycerophosphotransferase
VAARISVAVPVYNVEPYLEACLESLARQTMSDIEVIIVNDGSSDASPEIAEHFIARDARFRLVHQANAGLGAARNTGAAHANGEFLAFVDSDDLVPRHAYELLLDALDTTGSDFACGMVKRFTSLGAAKPAFMARAFSRTRLQTHITRFPHLLADRTAWNKLFRRSFWDRHDFRFPEGVFYEDIPVTLPAHYLARSVDVISQTVYLWRTREGGDFSITQRRADSKHLRDRVAAAQHVSRFLEAQGLFVSKALYDRSVIREDLRYSLDLLARGGDEYRQLFIELANDFMSRADSWVLDQPFAIDRVKWELVRRRALPELLEVLRFEEEEMSEVPAVRRRRRWYGDYPFRDDDQLELPARAYRLDNELAPVVRINDIRWQGERLRVDGYAYITMVGAPEPGSQTVEVLARRPGLRGRTVQFETEPVFRPDVTAMAAQQSVGLDWSGFSASVDATDLIRGGRDEDTWEIRAVIRAQGVKRSTRRLDAAPLHSLLFRETNMRGRHLSAGFLRPGQLVAHVQRRRASVRSLAVDDRVLELEGETGPSRNVKGGLELSRRLGGAPLRYPVYVGSQGPSTTFLARIPLMDLLRAPEEEQADEAVARGGETVWEVSLAGSEGPMPLAAPRPLPQLPWTVDGREIALELTRGAHLALAERSVRPLLTDAHWSPEGTLHLVGAFAGAPGDYEVSLRARKDGESHFGTVTYAEREVTAELTAGAIVSLAGTHPLAEGMWDIFLGARDSEAPPVTPAVSQELLQRLPAAVTVERKRFQFGVSDGTTPVLSVERDLSDGERGGFAQRTLRTSYYPSQRQGRLRPAVVYECFGGTQYSDSPRAIHEELVRRETPLEQLWVVRDAAFVVPETARPLRQGSEEYYEALARSRYIVANDHWPRWFVGRSGQTCLQTWHGAPLKTTGLALAARPKAVRAYWRGLAERAENWRLVVSPGSFATPIIRGAFPAGEVLETGLPRTDLLVRPERERIVEEVRRRLGLAARRVVLYAPTYLDHLEYRRSERTSRVRDVPTYAADLDDHAYRQGPLLDLEALHRTLGDDYAILYRKHRRVLDRLTRSAAPSTIDVSDYPDIMELLLVADVLVTDYCSIAFDFACTGKPILFYTPRLEEYRDEVRGFSIDFEAVAPGPLLRTTEDIVDALRDPEAIRAAYDDRYEAFVESYCGLSDGHATERVVDRVFDL